MKNTNNFFKNDTSNLRGIGSATDYIKWREQAIKTQQEQAKNQPKTTGKENVAGTAGYLTGKAVKGGTGFFEGIADLGAAALKGVGVASSWAANNAVGKAIFGKDAGDYRNNPLYQIGSQMQQDEVAGTVGNVVNKELEKYSYAKDGGLASSVAEGIGFVGANVLTAGAMGAAGKGGKYAPMFTSTTGNEFTQSTNDGNSTGKSLLYAAGKGAIETGSEMLFGGIGKVFGKGALDDVVVGSITKRIKSTVGKKLAEVGIKAVGEGLEENVSGLLTPILQRMTIDPNAKMYWQNKDGKLDLTQAGLDFVVGGITSAIMQTPSAIGDVRGNNKNLNTLKSINQQLSNEGLDTTNNNELMEQANFFNTDENIQSLVGARNNLSNSLQAQNFTNDQITQKTMATPKVNEIKPLTISPTLNQNNSKIDVTTPKAKVINKTTPEMTTTENLFAVRDYADVGKRNIKAYQYENPEVKPYFIEEANALLSELKSSVKGERFYIPQDDTYDLKVTGNKRITTPDIAELLDGVDGQYRYSYSDIEKGLNAIIEDHGAENNAISKRIEFYLDKRLRNGVENKEYGYTIEPNQDYLKVIGKQTPQTVEQTNLAAVKEEDVLMVKPTKQQVAESKKETDTKIAEIVDNYPTTERTERPIMDILKSKLVDKGFYIKKLGRAAKNRTLEAKYDNIISSRGMAESMIGGDGVYDKANNKLSDSLLTIFEKVETSNKVKPFSEYMYHQLNIDRMSLSGKYGDNKPVFGEGVTAEISKQKVLEFEKENPEFKTWAKEVYKYNEALLQRAVDTGVISQESFDYYKEKYPHYIPIKRIGVNNNAGEITDFGKASVGNAIKTAKGGSQDLAPLKEAMALNTYSMTRAGQRNIFANELSKVLNTKSATEEVDVDTTISDIESDSDLLTAGDKTTTPTLTYFENGEKKTIAINTEIYEALKSTYIRDIKTLSSISNLRRSLITEYNLAFMLTNPIKDIQDGLINSQHPKTFIKNIVEATKQIKDKGKFYQMYMANGGNQNSYFNYDKGFVAPKNPKGIKGAITYPLRKISEINQFIEMTPRLSEFISSIEAGDSIEVAMYNAAEVTTNFKAGGDVAKLLNKNGATFLNASIQGAYKQVRNIQDAKSNGLKGVAHLLVRFTLAALPYHILNGLLWGDDDDYEQLSDYIKDNYYILGKYADGRFIKIPKGRVVGLLQKTVRSIGDTPTEGIEAWDGFLTQIENSIVPNNPLDNNIFSPLLQAATNKAWYGGELLPMRLKDKAPSEQYDESTDEFSKFLGKNLGISPYKINYVLDQYSGVVGDMLLPSLTKEAEQGNAGLGKALAPLTDKFTTDSVLKNQKVSDFYDLTEKVRLAAQKENATSQTTSASKYMNRQKAAISKLYKEKREIQLSNIKDQTKYNKAREIQKEINKLANDSIIKYGEIKKGK